MDTVIEYDGHVFTLCKLFELDVIKTDHGFFNATKLCQNQGYTSVYAIRRKQEWKDYYENIKQTIHINQDNNDRLVTDNDLIYEVKTRGLEYKSITGVYLSDLLLEKFVELLIPSRKKPTRCFSMNEITMNPIEKPAIEKYVFEQTDYNGISVIREVNSNFYNATKMCRDNGIEFRYIARSDYWQEYIKTYVRLNKAENCYLHLPVTNTTFESQEQGEARTCKNSRTLSKSESQEQGGTRPLENEGTCYKSECMTLILDLSNNVDNRYRGIYIHRDLVNFLCMHINFEYAIKVTHIMNMIDEEIHLRNITLETKIKEQDAEIERLKQKSKEDNSGFDHSYTGCIILRHMEGNMYRLSSDTKNRFDNKNWTMCWNDIHNPTEVCSELRYYIKYGCWNDMRFVKYFHGACIEIDNIDKFAEHIKEVQEFNVQAPPIETMIEKCKEGFKEVNALLKARMFEIYCYIISGIKPCRYEPCEKLSLKKNDNGLDLLNLKTRQIGQCKYYNGSTVGLNSLTQFINFCQDFPDFEHYLFVSSTSKISKDIQGLDDLIIKVVNDDEYTKWFDHNVGEFKVFEAVNKQIHVKKEPLQLASEWLSNELKTHLFIKRDDALNYIQSTFGIKIVSGSYFGNLFSNLYKVGNGGRMPKDIFGNVILIDKYRDLNAFEHNQLIDIIKNGQYTLEELVEEYGKLFKMTFAQTKFLEVHKDIFLLNNRDLPFVRRVNGKATQLYELNEKGYPQKYKELWKHIEPLIDDNYTVTQIAESINKTFHRHESPQTTTMLIKKLKQ